MLRTQCDGRQFKYDVRRRWKMTNLFSVHVFFRMTCWTWRAPVAQAYSVRLCFFFLGRVTQSQHRHRSGRLLNCRYTNIKFGFWNLFYRLRELLSRVLLLHKHTRTRFDINEIAAKCTTSLMFLFGQMRTVCRSIEWQERTSCGKLSVVRHSHACHENSQPARERERKREMRLMEILFFGE